MHVNLSNRRCGRDPLVHHPGLDCAISLDTDSRWNINPSERSDLHIEDGFGPLSSLTVFDKTPPSTPIEPSDLEGRERSVHDILDSESRHIAQSRSFDIDHRDLCT